jgi:hypothetical protein
MLGMSLQRWAMGTLALTAACGSGTTSGSVQLLVISYDPASAQYQVAPKEVTTLHHLDTLDGDAAKILIGAKISVDPAAIGAAAPTTSADLDKLIFTAPGGPIKFDSFTQGGYVYPADAHALGMATTYYNFEQAQMFFTAAGATVGAVSVQYEPQVSGALDGPLSAVTDSPVSDPYLHAFVVPDRGTGSDVPAGLQLGIVGHQYAHFVFRTLVYGDDGLPWLEAKRAKDPKSYAAVANLVRSLDEGLADYFGAAIAADPQFIRPIAAMPDAGRRLDPATPRCVTSTLIMAQQSQTREQYDPYPLGSALSMILWDVASARTDLQPKLNAGLVAGLQSLGKQLNMNDAHQSLGGALDAIVSTMPGDVQARACGEFFDRFRMSKTDIPSCTSSRTPEQRCAF